MAGLPEVRARGLRSSHRPAPRVPSKPPGPVGAFGSPGLGAEARSDADFRVTELLLAIGLIAMAAVSLFRLPPFHPAQLWLVPWAITSTLYAFRFLPYNPLRPETAGLIAGASLAFAACSWVAGRGRPAGHSDGTRGVDTRHFGVARRAALLLLGLTALWLTAYLVQVVAQYGLRAAIVSDPRVRTSVRLGEYAVTIKFVYAALAAAMACALVAAVSFTPAAQRRWLMVTVLPICSVYFSTGRSNFVTGVAMAGLVYVVARPMRPSLRQAAVAGLAAAVLFVLTLFVGGAIIGKTYNASELATIDTVFSRTPELQPLALPYQYASAPIASLNELVASVGPWGATSGCATLAPGCRLFATVGPPLEACPASGGSRPRLCPGTPIPLSTHRYSTPGRASQYCWLPSSAGPPAWRGGWHRRAPPSSWSHSASWVPLRSHPSFRTTSSLTTTSGLFCFLHSLGWRVTG